MGTVLKWALPNGEKGTYNLTNEDKMWLTAAAVGEGADPLEVLQTLAQRFVFLRTQPWSRNKYPELHTFVRAYSQPINPIWARGGSRCPTAAPGDCAEHRLKRREKLQAIQDVTDLPRNEAYETAQKWLKGQVKSDKVPGAVHFAIHSRVDGRPVFKSRSQTFASVPLTEDWPVDAVVIENTSDYSWLVATMVGAVVGLSLTRVFMGLWTK